MPFLNFLVVKRGYILHGSPRRIDALVPHEADDLSKEFGRAHAIYATTNPVVALAHAVLHRDELRQKGVSFQWSYRTNDQGEVEFSFSQEIYKHRGFQEGFIHVLAREDFEFLPGSGEARARKNVRPILAIPVTPQDFFTVARILPPQQ